MMYTVRVLDNGSVSELRAEAGELLLDVLSKGGIAVSAPCGGNGKCGKCRVIVHEGLPADDDGTCLACRTYILQNCTVEIHQHEAKVLVKGLDVSCETDGEEGYGLAVDVGTTTVAAYIIELSSGKTVKTLSELNPQRAHGADVISRLEYAGKCDENAALLKQEIDTMLSSFVNSGYAIKRAVIVGNTVMMHLAGGYDSESLAKAPFVPFYMSTHIRLMDGVKTVLGGVVSGYVGADTVAAVLACGFDSKDETALMVDIGTNGEIVLKHNGRMLSCSCAAGPAFEGAHIICGTGAVNGAVDHIITDENGKFRISTIAGMPAIGICGSGLVDAVAFLLDEEIVSPVGRMEKQFDISDKVFIAPQDIREVQLAKAAISAGIRILMDRLDVEFDEIEHVYLAGGFGNYFNIQNACKIGLLPDELLDKITPVGNAAGTGARMMTVSGEARRRYERLRSRIEYIELSVQDDFEDEYAEGLIFGNDG